MKLFSINQFPFTLAVIFSSLLTGCAVFDLATGERSDGFGSRSAEWDEPTYSRPVRTQTVVDRAGVESRDELRAREENLRPGLERRQYDNFRAYLTERERLEFLRLPTLEAREKYMQNKGAIGTAATVSNYTASNPSVRLGMGKKTVKDMLGEPDQVEFAGSPVYGNERWQYTVESSNERGFQKKTRVIYFEGGRVVGWQTL